MKKENAKEYISLDICSLLSHFLHFHLSSIPTQHNTTPERTQEKMSCKSLSMSLLPRLGSKSKSLGTMDGYLVVARTHPPSTLSSSLVPCPVPQPRYLAHHSHGHPHHKPTNSTTPGQGALSDALTASVLPVGTATPGAPVAHSLASAPGKAPSTIPSTAPSGASASSNKVIVVFKAGTPAEEIEAAVKDCESKGRVS